MIIICLVFYVLFVVFIYSLCKASSIDSYKYYGENVFEREENEDNGRNIMDKYE